MLQVSLACTVKTQLDWCRRQESSVTYTFLQKAHIYVRHVFCDNAQGVVQGFLWLQTSYHTCHIQIFLNFYAHLQHDDFYSICYWTDYCTKHTCILAFEHHHEHISHDTSRNVYLYKTCCKFDRLLLIGFECCSAKNKQLPYTISISQGLLLHVPDLASFKFQ